MPANLGFLLGLAILACAFVRAKDKSDSAGASSRWWQKLLGVIAIALTVLIVINPEFLAIGLLGDAAFFDLLVLLITLRLQMLTTQAGVWALSLVSKIVFWFRKPRMSYALALWGWVLIQEKLESIQKFVHRIAS